MDWERQVVVERGSHSDLHRAEDLGYGQHRRHQLRQPRPWQNWQKHRHAAIKRRACRTRVVAMESAPFTDRPVSGRYGIVVDAAAMPGNAKSAVRVE